MAAEKEAVLLFGRESWKKGDDPFFAVRMR
jgi:hypothetical protein